MHKGLAWWEALPHASRAESAGSLDAGPRCLGSLTRIWHGTPPRMLNNRREAFRRIGHVRMAHAMWSSEHPTCLPPAYGDTQSIQLSGFKGDDCAALTEGNAIDTHPAPGPVKPTQCVRRIPLQSSSQVSSVHTSEPRATIVIPRHKKNSLKSFPQPIQGMYESNVVRKLPDGSLWPTPRSFLWCTRLRRPPRGAIYSH